MKKLIFMLILLILVFSLISCGSGEEDIKSGLVVTCGGNPYMFELACDDGKNYGFAVTDDTEFIWEDDSAFNIWDKDADSRDVFSTDMRVDVVVGEKTESADKYVDECVEGWYKAKKVTITKVEEEYFYVSDKPVIYLYPQEETDVTVSLDYNGELTCTYPKSDGTWSVKAQPDGTLTDENGTEYNYLYWEGISDTEFDMSKGFCVKGEDTAKFLEQALAKLGLTRREANEFIVYWLPIMEANEYNVIAFQNETYTENAELTVEPEPDTVIRVFMAWYGSDEEIDIDEQEMTAPQRKGFTVVEWGGSKIK